MKIFNLIWFFSIFFLINMNPFFGHFCTISMDTPQQQQKIEEKPSMIEVNKMKIKFRYSIFALFVNSIS